MVPFVDLKTQYQALRHEIDPAVAAVFEGGRFILGPEVTAFEREFATYSQSRSAIGVNTGTSALHLALLALGVGPGDEVITVPFTFVATVAAIAYTGARTVFVDIDPTTLTMDPSLLEAAISPKTKAIIPVHLYGRPANMTAISAIAIQHGLKVVEDACQAHGAEHRGRRTGSLADIACFSFYPGKNLGAYGEGGAVTTDDPELERAVRSLRNWGAENKYEHRIKGFNFRLEEIQAAILRVKLRHLEDWTEARRDHAARYSADLAGLGLGLPSATTDRHVFHIYEVRTTDREGLAQRLLQRGIETGIHYPIPVHLQQAHADLGYRMGDFPHSERAADEVLSLPMFPELTAAQQDEVIAALNQTVRV